MEERIERKNKRWNGKEKGGRKRGKKNGKNMGREVKIGRPGNRGPPHDFPWCFWKRGDNGNRDPAGYAALYPEWLYFYLSYVLEFSK